MKPLHNNYRILRKITEQEIRQQVKKIAQDISNEYQDREPILIGVLNGVFIFSSDLVREISIPLKIDFVRLASYGSKDVSSGKITFSKDIDLPVKGKPVIIVEDIIDTGSTLSFLVAHIKEKEPESIKICALINKLDRREKEIKVDYWGFEIKEGFMVGYGLDYNEKFRYLPYILGLEIRA
ncbi:MAG: hypoxanthine phosphoribosyltransferase [Deltaproteobacteria bacterium]|nr:hypoxanthine phosphoribosyltransferase [Deltaproteobacteria bacterium]